jgi:1,2-phenylacetyl-CoA epoxidase PaaB subunit
MTASQKAATQKLHRSQQGLMMSLKKMAAQMAKNIYNRRVRMERVPGVRRARALRAAGVKKLAVMPRV